MDLSDDVDGSKWRDRVLIEMAKGNKALIEVRDEIRKTRSFLFLWFILLPILGTVLAYLFLFVLPKR